MKMTTQNIKLKNIININTQKEVCSQYNNRKVDYSRSVIKVDEPLKIVDTDGVFFQHEMVEEIFEDNDNRFEVMTTNKIWFFEYYDDNWNCLGGGNNE
jgi:hypothetical protein